MRMTIHRRIFFSIMVVVIGFVLAVNIMILKLFDNIAYEEVLRELQHSVLSYNRFNKRHQDLLITQARAMAETAHLKATLNIPDVDHETVQVAAESLRNIANPDILLVIGQSGELLSNANEANQMHHPFVKHKGVQQALSGQLVSGVWSTSSGVYQVAVVPSAIDELFFGAVLVGYRLDSLEAIQELQDVTGSMVQIDRPDGSTKAIGHALTLSPVIDGEQITTVEDVPLFEFSDQSGRWLVASIKDPDSESTIMLLKELDAVASIIDPIKLFVAIGSIFAILLGMLITNQVALKVSRPISILTDAASRFGKGEFSTRVAKDSDDEIGRLTETFNLMADDIVMGHEKLIASKEAAEAATRTKSEFLAKMSHEIRTPMNGVIGITELLLRTDLTEKQYKFGETISRSADSLLTIVNDILDFSKIEAGKLELESVEFDLKELVEDTVALLTEIASKKGIALISKFQYGLPLLVFGDSNRLRQVLNNLIHNAIKFTEEGEVCIKVQISEQQSANAEIMAKFEIIDSGIGINVENQSKIFESFAQEDNSTTRKYGGTGLGLSICQQLITLMGGRINFVSQPDEGSNFNFNLKFKLSDENNILEFESHASAENTTELETKAITQYLDKTILDGLTKLPHPTESNLAEAAVMNYLIYTPKLLYEFDHVCLIKSPRLAKTLAQQMKSASFSVGAMHLADLCNRLEQLSQDTTFDASHLLINEIKRHYDLVKIKLESYLTKIIDNANHPVQINPSTATDKTKGNAENILLAEDNSVNREVAIGMLEYMGYNVTAVLNGAQALEALQEQHYGLVLMDCQMPEVDGYHATQLIRRLQEQGKIQKELKIIAVTANALEGDRERCINAGMDDYLSKPYTYEELNELLQHWNRNISPDETQLNSNVINTLNTAEAVAKVQINASVLERLHELEQSVSKEYARTIASNYNGKASTVILNDLQKAINNKDFNAVKRASQNFRACTLDIGAKYLGELCLRIENLTKFKSIEEIQSLFEDIQAECQDVVSVLYLYLENNSMTHKMTNHTEAVTKNKKPISKNGTTSILLAEDNPINQDVAIGMLENLGCTVTLAKDGDEAIEAFKNMVFDLVLLDCQMPVVDGLTAAGYMRIEEIRRESKNRIPIIALTANALEGDRERCLASGMDDFISKPYTQDQLQNLIQNWLIDDSQVA